MAGGAATDSFAIDLAPLIAAQRRRLKLRHLLAFSLAVLGTLVALGCLLEGLGLAHRDSVLRHVTRPALVVIGVALYVPCTVAMTVIWSRFDLRQSVRRYPLVFFLSLLPLILAAAQAALQAFGANQLLSSTHGGGGGGGNTGSRRGARRKPQVNLASAVLSKEAVGSVIGTPASEPVPADSPLAPRASISTCAAEGGSERVTLFVYPRDQAPGWIRRRVDRLHSPHLEQRGPRLGALVWNEAWVVMLSTTQGNNGRVGETELTSAAQGVLVRLPVES